MPIAPNVSGDDAERRASAEIIFLENMNITSGKMLQTDAMSFL